MPEPNAYKNFKPGDQVLIVENNFDGMPSDRDYEGREATVVDGTQFLNQATKFEVPHVVVKVDPDFNNLMWMQEDGLKLLPDLNEDAVKQAIASIMEAFHE